jgi:hypothetical protein
MLLTASMMTNAPSAHGSLASTNGIGRNAHF